MADDTSDRQRVSTRPTVKLDPSEIVGAERRFQLAIDALNDLSDDAVYAFRLGQLALLQECVRQMALPGARGDLVVRARVIVETLARLPWQPR